MTRTYTSPAAQAVSVAGALAVLELGRRQAELVQLLHDDLAGRGEHTEHLAGLRAALDQLNAALHRWQTLPDRTPAR
ncbi:hypothetical protein [Spirilliplanes yamanashiensis]|uniref:hypothetical protein n=1 Tax=Spirilliplanes yamanashiensis TaxID=42233 RepID=UPI0019500DB5|nr:hypothetical protein [Spirilliplanes yamanashiensis]MDP9815501.1 hypothetical protein [Spirilliplanes yamanashiensis]